MVLQFRMVTMHWEMNIVTSVTLLALLRGHDVSAVSQESVYVIECIRDIIPSQIFNECCLRDNNCTITREQNKGIDCMSRIIMTNYSSLFFDSRENGQGTTDMNHSHQRGSQWYGEFPEHLGEACKRQPRSRLQNCIRNELIKKCRYSMLQDRFGSSSPGRWTRYDSDTTLSGHPSDTSRSSEPRRRSQFFTGGRDDMMSRPSDSEYRYYSPAGFNEDSDDEEFGHSDGDPFRY